MSAPIDSACCSGVECKCRCLGESQHLDPVIGAIRRTMREIRNTNKPGMLVIRWEPATKVWSIHPCGAPERRKDDEQ